MDSDMDTRQDIEPETDAFAGADLSMVPADRPNGHQETRATDAPHAWFRAAVNCAVPLTETRRGGWVPGERRGSTVNGWADISGARRPAGTFVTPVSVLEYQLPNGF